MNQDEMADKIFFYCECCNEEYELPENIIYCPICGSENLEPLE